MHATRIRKDAEDREEEVWMPPVDGSWKEKYEALLKHHDATTRMMKPVTFWKEP